MTTIANPLTGQVLNANPEGHNQYVNPDGPSRVRSLIDSKVALQAKIRSLGAFYGGHYEKISDSPILREAYKPFPTARSGGIATTGKRIETAGPREFSREVLAHEIGHVASGHSKPLVRGSFLEQLRDALDRTEVNDEGSSIRETEAWRWAMKNRKKFGLSKRKIARLARCAVSIKEISK